MNAAVGEIKKLNESLSQLRQENIVLKVGLLFCWSYLKFGGVLEVLSHYWEMVDTSS